MPVVVSSFFLETERPRNDWLISSSTQCAERFPSMREFNRGDGGPTIPYSWDFAQPGAHLRAHGKLKVWPNDGRGAGGMDRRRAVG